MKHIKLFESFGKNPPLYGRFISYDDFKPGQKVIFNIAGLSKELKKEDFSNAVKTKIGMAIKAEVVSSDSKSVKIKDDTGRIIDITDGGDLQGLVHDN